MSNSGGVNIQASQDLGFIVKWSIFHMLTVSSGDSAGKTKRQLRYYGYWKDGRMTSDEIKQSISMREILQQYGVQIGRNGMCSCPFHKDKHPSMKVYKDAAKCFSCGWYGDIFAFVMKAENESFNDAFKRLGGSHEQFTNEINKSQFKADIQARKASEERKKKEESKFYDDLILAIKICEGYIEIFEPFSDGWTFGHNQLQKLNEAYRLKYEEGEEINEIDVYRQCRQVRRSVLL